MIKREQDQPVTKYIESCNMQQRKQRTKDNIEGEKNTRNNKPNKRRNYTIRSRSAPGPYPHQVSESLPLNDSRCTELGRLLTLPFYYVLWKTKQNKIKDCSPFWPFLYGPISSRSSLGQISDRPNNINSVFDLIIGLGLSFNSPFGLSESNKKITKIKMLITVNPVIEEHHFNLTRRQKSTRFSSKIRLTSNFFF